jgi:hypothetical protein
MRRIMPNRVPRGLAGGKTVLIQQTAVIGEAIFPEAVFCLHFLCKLKEAAAKGGFSVLGYSLTENELGLIIRSGAISPDRPLLGLFTSVAKTYRNACGGKGHVFSGAYSSRILADPAAVAIAKRKLSRRFLKQLAAPRNEWPFLALSAAGDRFGVCTDHGHPIQKPKALLDRPYLTEHGRVTVHWYIAVYEGLRKLAAPDRTADA